jgi:hypothetical protein
MRAALAKVGRAILLGLAAGLTACSDASGPLVAPVPDQPHLLLANSTETLATGLNLTNGSSVTWNVSMPSSGTIRLSFDGRIDYPSTAGNSTILEVLVNGTPVTAAHLFNKDTLYTYVNRGGTENYYALRGAGWGQAAKYWGLFWSPDFVSNNTSSDYYYVQGAKAYAFVMNVSGLINYGQVNTIQLINRGGWVQSATGNSPTIALRDVKVQSVSPLGVNIYGSTEAQPYQSCTFYADATGGTPPYTYEWTVNGWPEGGNSSELMYTNQGYSYTVGVLVTDASGAQASDSHYVAVTNSWRSCLQ